MANYRGRFAWKHRKNKRSLVLLASLVLIFGIAIGTTVAYLMDIAETVENTFIPAKVKIAIQETTTATQKSEIYFTNPKTDEAVDAYIRANLVIYWTDVIEGKEVIVPAPTNFGVTGGTSLGDNWLYSANSGIYYYTKPVAPGGQTTMMLKDALVVTEIPENSSLKCHIEVHAEAIQANPSSVVVDEWGVTLTGTTITAVK